MLRHTLMASFSQRLFEFSVFRRQSQCEYSLNRTISFRRLCANDDSGVGSTRSSQLPSYLIRSAMLNCLPRFASTLPHPHVRCLLGNQNSPPPRLRLVNLSNRLNIQDTSSFQQTLPMYTASLSTSGVFSMHRSMNRV